MTLDVRDATGALVRHFSSSDVPPPVDANALNVPTYWIRPAVRLSAAAGMHRFVWDLHEAPPFAFERDYPISAIPGDTPLEPLGALVVPGTYAVTLHAATRAFTVPLAVTMDPRVHVSTADLVAEHTLATKIVTAMNATAPRRFSSGSGQPDLNGRLAQLLDVVEGADAAPTAQAQATFETLSAELGGRSK